MILIVCFFSGLTIIQAAASDENVPATSGRDMEVGDFAKNDALTPHPGRAPGDVVRIQLNALAKNDNPYKDAGIETTFRFASPANKQATGPLSRFIRMLYNPLYSPMLDNQAASYGDLIVEGDRARQPVILMTADDQRVGYMFFLSKQKGGPFDQCWMTDSVIRFEVDNV
jgi:hypothetical protein